MSYVRSVNWISNLIQCWRWRQIFETVFWNFECCEVEELVEVMFWKCNQTVLCQIPCELRINFGFWTEFTDQSKPARFEVLMAVLLKINIFGDVTSCRHVVADVSTVFSAFIFCVKQSEKCELGTAGPLQTSVTVYQSARRNIQEGLSFLRIYLRTHLVLRLWYTGQLVR